MYQEQFKWTAICFTIQFNKGHSFAHSLNVSSFIWSIDWTLSGATTPSQSEPGSIGDEKTCLISQTFWPHHQIV